MESSILIAGLGLSLAGTVVLAMADAWLSQSMLVYLDAVEANVAKVVEAVRTRGTEFKVTGVNLQRDRRQNSARGLKMLGWLVVAFGFGLQLAAAYWTRSAA
jgi:hypothetical protein